MNIHPLFTVLQNTETGNPRGAWSGVGGGGQVNAGALRSSLSIMVNRAGSGLGNPGLKSWSTLNSHVTLAMIPNSPGPPLPHLQDGSSDS